MGEFTSLLEEWDETGWEGLPESPLVELSKFKDATFVIVAGVYVLLRGVVVVYIGHAQCLARRIGQHREEKKIKFDSVKVFPCAHKGRMLAMERRLIREHRPKWNEKSKPVPRPNNVIPLRQLLNKAKVTLTPMRRPKSLAEADQQSLES